MCNACELVGERDIDRAEGVLEQSGQLGRLRARHLVRSAAHVTQYLGGRDRAFRSHSSDDAHGPLGSGRRIRRVDTPRAERHVHVDAHPEATLLQRVGQQLPGAPDVRGRAQHDRLPRHGVSHHGLAGFAQRRLVRNEVRVDRGRNTDQHGCSGGEHCRLARQRQPVRADVGVESGLVAIAQARLPGLDRRQAILADVISHHPEPGGEQAQRRSQAHAAQPEHAHHGHRRSPHERDTDSAAGTAILRSVRPSPPRVRRARVKGPDDANQTAILTVADS